MHELSVCRGLLAQVERVRLREGARRVRAVTLRIGPLSGVDPGLLRQAFPLAARDTPAEGAELHIEEEAVEVSCPDCGARTRARPDDLRCALCGGHRTRLVSGDALLLVSLELSKEEAHV